MPSIFGPGPSPGWLPRLRLSPVGVAFTLLILFSARGWAQEVVEARLQGRVVVGDSLTALPGARVLLHRVDPVDAGVMDSVRTDGEGAFRFVLPGVPDPEGRGEVYFASVRHQGVLYFGNPVAAAIQLDSLYRIQVYDTLAVDARAGTPSLSLRYLLVEEAGEGGWQVTDLLQLDVSGRNTLVPGADSVTWSYPLPPGARNVRVGGSDVAGETARVESGRVAVIAPLTPGMRQVVLRYDLDSLAASVPLPGGIAEMELLVRDPAPPMEVVGLMPTGPVALEDGVMYRRYAGRDLSDTVITFRATEEPFAFPVRWLAVALGLIFAATAVVVLKRRPLDAGTPGPAGPASASSSGVRPRSDRDALVRQIAELDIALEDVRDPVERETLLTRRRRLVERLRGAG